MLSRVDDEGRADVGEEHAPWPGLRRRPRAALRQVLVGVAAAKAQPLTIAAKGLLTSPEPLREVLNRSLDVQLPPAEADERVALLLVCHVRQEGAGALASALAPAL